jgi:putative transposase
MEKTARRAYQTDLNDEQYGLLEPLVPTKQTDRGRPRTWPLREILNAIFYIVRSGCAWRLMPHDLPPWQTVYGYTGRKSNECIGVEASAGFRSGFRLKP